MRIISSSKEEINTLEDYRVLASPKEEYQWAPNHSAMEFAKKVVNHTFEKEINEIIPSLELLFAYPERKTSFDIFGGPRNHDLACIGQKENEKIAICVEAKATETFGSTTVKKELDDAYTKLNNGDNTNIPKRIEGLCLKLWNKSVDSEIEKLQYQLLHATMGTVAFANEKNIKKAIFVVYQLETLATTQKQLEEHFDAFKSFSKIFNKSIKKDSLCYVGIIDDVELSLLYIQRPKDL